MRIRILAILITCLSGSALMGQDIPADVSPTTISDQQLKEGMEKAAQQGYSQQQIESLARARGLSEGEISTLRQRIQSLQEQKVGTQISDAELREELGEFDLNVEDIQENDPIKGNFGGKVFGSDLFNNSNLTFTPSINIPTPENYILGPGDEIVIDIWGASEKTYQLTIGPEGSIKIPQLGPIYLNGLEISRASAKILSRLTQIYSGLEDTGPREKDTYGQVSLGRIRSIKVNVIGEVRVPGTYTMSSLSTVLHALYQAGGPSESGSYRNVQLFRNGKQVALFDAYDFLINGQVNANLTLKDQDVLLIPFYNKRVRLLGEVKNPAIFELKEHETLRDLLNYAGSLTDEGYVNLVTIKRLTKSARKILTVKSGNFQDFELFSGDVITVAPIFETFENRVVIDGAVWRPGEYELTDSLSLSELIIKAEGLTGDAFLERGRIIRLNSDLSIRNISFSVNDVVNGRTDYLLFREDMVIIKSKFGLREGYHINVQGEVRSPGIIDYADSLTVEDAIFISGGFTESASRSFVEVARRLDSNSDDNDNVAEIYNFPIDESLNLSDKGSGFKLEPYDLVVVRRSPTYETQSIVEVDGQVSYPGKYALEKKEERISDLLKRAGGLNVFAYVEGATLIRQTEYFGTQEDEGNEAAALRKAELEELLIDEDLLDGSKQTFKRQESVGISLAEIIKNPGSKYDLILHEGDILNVPKQLQTVRIRGEVLYPSTVRYDGTKSFKEFIAEAGGFTDGAQPKRAYIVYANGSAASTKRFLWMKDFPRVGPGAEIIVPTKPEQIKLSPQEIVALSSAILSMVLVIDRLTL